MIKNLETKEIEFAGETLALISNGSVYWTEKKLLLIADSHLGKTHYFNENGVQLPKAGFRAQLQRLDETIAYTGAQELLVLGDMFHHERAITDEFYEEFKHWKNSFSGKIDCIVGNHDKYLTDLNVKNDVNFVEEYKIIDNIIFAHDKVREIEGLSQMYGHRHPRYILKDHGGVINLPCFWLKGDHLILPAFSTLCSGTAINNERRSTDRVILALEDEGLIEI